MFYYKKISSWLNGATLLFFTSAVLAAPGTPKIAWLNTQYDTPATYTIHWDMWWGINGTKWYLLENGQSIYSENLVPKGQNEQSGSYSLTKTNGGQYSYVVRLCDAQSCTESVAKVITVSGDTATNQPPAVNAGTDLTTEINIATNLNGSFTDDGISTPVTVNWQLISGSGAVNFTSPNQAMTQATFSAAGNYVLQLSVSDTEFTVTDSVNVTVSEQDVNQSPVANAGDDQSSTPNQTISLSGSYVDDGKTSPITESWVKVSGPGTITFSNPAAGNSTATFSAVGNYVLSYTVNDTEFSSSDQLNVEISDGSPLDSPSAPTIAWLTDNINLDSGSVDITVRWNMYWGLNGNEWRLSQNGVVIHTDALTVNGSSAQSGQKVVTLTTANTYQFIVSLCNVAGSQQACTDSPAVTVVATGGTSSDVACGTSSEACLPNRDDPVDLKVKGWPGTLAMGTVTDNNMALNNQLASAQVDAIFKYEGDGAGNRGALIDPIVTAQTIDQSRRIELINGVKVVPTMVVYTANASNGGVASEDITDYANLVKHYQNLIRMSALMQVHKDFDHTSPASVVLNADLLGEWQKDAGFNTAYGDSGSGSWTSIQIRQALKEAITNDSNYQVADYNGSLHNLSDLYDLNALKIEIDSVLSDNILGWVQSQNFILKRFSPDVSFGWVINLWNPGTANWTHNNFSGLQAVWNSASKSVSEFINYIGAYEDNDYRPDFLTFDKYERDGFSPLARGSYAYGAKEWDNYLTYVKQITDYLDVPAMIWQIPGGHMATTGEATGNYDLQNHSASAASYFMGDKNIGSNISNIKSKVLNIPLNSVIYNGATSVDALLQQSPEHDWGVSQLRHAAFSNVFSIMWGGGSTTAIVPIATNGTGDNNWLKNKVVNYKANGKIPLYHVAAGSNASPLTSISALNAQLESVETVMNNDVFLFQTPSNSWVPSSIYKWADFLDALNPMHNTGVEDVKFWLIDPIANEETNIKYAKVAIAAFLSQSMKETIQYDACDENNWSINTGEPVNYPLSSSCGQLGQVYEDYGTNPVTGADNPYSCPRNPKMEMTAKTHAKWYGAPAPLFVAPNAVLSELGLLVNGNVGYWNYSTDCSNSTGSFDPQKQGYLQEECSVYEGQGAGKFVWDGSAGKSIEGCGWWGRGVIQTTGRLNFGKLNHFIGRSHVDPDNVGQVIEGTLVKTAPENPLYADLDLCSNPELICSTQEHKEIKWIAGIFFWMNEVQGYNDVGGPYADWNYHEKLKAYVAGGLVGTEFIDDVSGIVNRGCPDTNCPVSGSVDGLSARSDNFKKVLRAMGLNPN